ncbi:MAG: hypothetical protein AMJ42_02370 [Deltaproteobacteria bacterium DG_8]|nr:MAG: hypothetical protein AMJ42_02370 [Deltaproteobacteria bacterium DG_8]
MKIFKQIVAILVVSFTCGLGFNAFSPHGIDIFDNPWSKNAGLNEQEPIIFVEFDRACRFIEGKEGIILDARSPEAYAKGHIPGAHLLFFYNMKEYYQKHKDLLKESPGILVYCGDIDCEDSEFLANELFNLGHAPIFVYRDGFEDWKSHQGCVETGKEKDECW